VAAAAVVEADAAVAAAVAEADNNSQVIDQEKFNENKFYHHETFKTFHARDPRFRASLPRLASRAQGCGTDPETI
jgi:hypothetical protein